jgi:hypothetical protein
MKPSSKWSRLLIIGALLAGRAHAQLAVEEPALVAVYGEISHRSKETINLEKWLWTIGERVFFAEKRWKTSATMVEGKCVRLNFSKDGSWTTPELRVLFDLNGGYASFSEQPTDNLQFRTWKHRSGIEAKVRGSVLTITHPLYQRRLAALEAEAKARAKAAPKS